MKKLGLRNYELIASSLNTMGFNCPEDGLMNEESMYVDEINEIYEFLKWLHASGKPFGPINYEERFSEFKAPKKRNRSETVADLSKGFTEAPKHRPLHKIAFEIGTNWDNVYFGAVPYLKALHQLNSIDDMFIMEPADMIVRYFLGNATTWRGETARRIKAELKDMIK